MVVVEGAGVEMSMGRLDGGGVSKGMGVLSVGDDVSGVATGDWSTGVG